MFDGYIRKVKICKLLWGGEKLVKEKRINFSL